MSAITQIAKSAYYRARQDVLQKTTLDTIPVVWEDFLKALFSTAVKTGTIASASDHHFDTMVERCFQVAGYDLEGDSETNRQSLATATGLCAAYLVFVINRVEELFDPESFFLTVNQ